MESLVDIELNKFLLQLSVDQKKSLLVLIRTYLHKETNPLLIEYNNEIEEAEAEDDSQHITNDEMLQKVHSWK